MTDAPKQRCKDCGLVYTHHTTVEALTAERDAFRAVVEGAGYRDIDGIAKQSAPHNRKLGEMAKLLTLEIIAERDALREAQTWQPIETAPKDGTKFDCWCIAPEGSSAARFTDVQMRGDKSGFGFIVHTRHDTIWCYLDGTGPDPIFPKWLPTHWQPLPTPPKETA